MNPAAELLAARHLAVALVDRLLAVDELFAFSRQGFSAQLELSQLPVLLEAFGHPVGIINNNNKLYWQLKHIQRK